MLRRRDWWHRCISTLFNTSSEPVTVVVHEVSDRVTESTPAARRIVLFVALFAWVLLLRAPTFLRSVVDWDESIYVLVASQWLHGHLPYTTVFDHKPVGIYAIFGIAFALFGESMFAIRLMTTAFVYLTAVAVFLLGRRLFASTVSGVLAAVCYPVFTLGLQGLSSNTELFFICFNVFGLHFLLKATSDSTRGRWLYGLAAGLSFGAALQTKYVVALEIAYFAVYVLVTRYRSAREAPFALLLFVVGVALPTALVVSYFWANDALHQFAYANFEANRRYLSASDMTDVWRGFSHSLQDWFKWNWVTMLGAAFVGHRSRSRPARRTAEWFLAGWLLVGFVESWTTLKFFKHYYLVTLPPLCLLFAGILARDYLAIGSRRVFVSVLAIVLGFPIARTVEKYYLPWITAYATHGDANVNIAEFVRNRIDPDDCIYVVNGHPIIYFLANARLPTKYVLPPLILSENLSHVAGVDYPAEVDRIFSKEPRYILVRDQREESARLTEITARLAQRYVLDAKIEDTTIYLRRRAE
jgi:4-amino-4-deoxy-L-arabinose transferase-like glycosyltransferase